MLGLTVANVVGVPFSSFLGQHLGWRSAYVFVAAVAALTVLLVWRQVPRVGAADGASPRAEVRALARPQVWLTVLTGAIGFGGMFAVYSYVAPILTRTSGWSPSFVPVALAVFGVGMTAGTALGGRLGDWSVTRALLIGLASQLVTLALFPLVAPSRAAVLVALVVLGVVSSLTATALQLRLMDVAGGDAAALGASLNHSALNIANAAGAFVGGLVIEAGYGWTAPAVVGAALAAVGLALAVTSLAVARRARRRLQPA
jgi:DHA1 family inner membrane transport protein